MDNLNEDVDTKKIKMKIFKKKRSPKWSYSQHIYKYKSKIKIRRIVTK